MVAAPDLVVSMRRQKVKTGKDVARLADVAREKSGHLTVIAGTGDAGDKVRVGQKVRVVGVRLPDVAAEKDAPAAAHPDAMSGEEMAAALESALEPLFPAGALRVRYVPPALWIDYAPLKFKIGVKSQRALGGLSDGPPVVSADQSAGPQGLFRSKEGTAREVVDYIVRFFKRLRDKPAPAGGKKRHAKATKRRAAKPSKGGRRYGSLSMVQALTLHRMGL